MEKVAFFGWAVAESGRLAREFDLMPAYPNFVIRQQASLDNGLEIRH